MAITLEIWRRAYVFDPMNVKMRLLGLGLFPYRPEKGWPIHLYSVAGFEPGSAGGACSKSGCRVQIH